MSGVTRFQSGFLRKKASPARGGQSQPLSLGSQRPHLRSRTPRAPVSSQAPAPGLLPASAAGPPCRTELRPLCPQAADHEQHHQPPAGTRSGSGRPAQKAKCRPGLGGTGHLKREVTCLPGIQTSLGVCECTHVCVSACVMGTQACGQWLGLTQARNKQPTGRSPDPSSHQLP